MSIGVTETEALRLFRDDQRALTPPVKFRGGAHTSKLVEAFGELPHAKQDEYMQRAAVIVQEMDSQPNSQTQQDERSKPQDSPSQRSERAKQPRINDYLREQAERMTAAKSGEVETQHATPPMVAVARSFWDNERAWRAIEALPPRAAENMPHSIKTLIHDTHAQRTSNGLAAVPPAFGFPPPVAMPPAMSAGSSVVPSQGAPLTPEQQAAAERRARTLALISRKPPQAPAAAGDGVPAAFLGDARIPTGGPLPSAARPTPSEALSSPPEGRRWIAEGRPLPEKMLPLTPPRIAWTLADLPKALLVGRVFVPCRKEGPARTAAHTTTCPPPESAQAPAQLGNAAAVAATGARTYGAHSASPSQHASFALASVGAGPARTKGGDAPNGGYPSNHVLAPRPLEDVWCGGMQRKASLPASDDSGKFGGMPDAHRGTQPGLSPQETLRNAVRARLHTATTSETTAHFRRDLLPLRGLQADPADEVVDLAMEHPYGCPFVKLPWQVKGLPHGGVQLTSMCKRAHVKVFPSSGIVDICGSVPAIALPLIADWTTDSTVPPRQHKRGR